MDGKESSDEGRLSTREKQILELLRQGLSTEGIARRIGTSPAGTDYYISSLLSKVGVRSREELLRQAPDGIPISRPLRIGPLQLPRVRRKRSILLGVVATTALLVSMAYILFQPSSTRSELEVGNGSNPLGRLAFIQNGDVWVITLPNGEPRRLTYEGIYSEPRWSPSGEWLAIGSSSQPMSAFIMRADGSDQRFAGGCGVWSPVEDVLACSGGTHFRLETPEGATLESFDLASLFHGFEYSPGNLSATCNVWRPDGQEVACVVAAELLGEGTNYGFTQGAGEPIAEYSGIWAVSIFGQAREVFANDPRSPGGGLAVVFDWSKDNAFIRMALYPPGAGIDEIRDGAPVYQVPTDGGELALHGIALPRRGLNGEPAQGGFALLSEGAGRETWTNKRITRMDLSSGSIEFLTGPEMVSLYPASAPDTNQIAYVAAPDAGLIDGLEGSASSDTSGAAHEAGQAMAHRRIWIMDGDGSNKHQLTNDNRFRDERPLWSEDGSHILFTRLDAEGAASVWLLHVAEQRTFKVAEISPCADSGAGSNCLYSLALALVTGPLWLGDYGFIPWFTLYDWWQPPVTNVGSP